MKRVSIPWLVAGVAIICVIWGNSLMPGASSNGFSLHVLDDVRSLLDSLGIASGWLTNFVVRKAAHFSEYAVLGAVMAKAIDPMRTFDRARLFALCLTLVLVPSIDETIQLFVPGRSGMVTDVLLDCSGAAFGALLSASIGRALRHRRKYLQK